MADLELEELRYLDVQDGIWTECVTFDDGYGPTALVTIDLGDGRVILATCGLEPGNRPVAE